MAWDAGDKKGMDVLRSSGVKVISADKALLAEVQKRSAPLIEDWIKKASAKGIDAKAVLEEFRAELKKVAASEKK
jgi:hypothetical protein